MRLEGENAAKSEELSCLTEAARTLQMDLKEATQSKEEAAAKVAKLEGQLKAAKNAVSKAAKLEEELQEARGKLVPLEEKVDNLTKENASLGEEVHATQGQLSNSHRKNLELASARDRLKEANSSLEAELQSVRDELERVKQEADHRVARVKAETVNKTKRDTRAQFLNACYHAYPKNFKWEQVEPFLSKREIKDEVKAIAQAWERKKTGAKTPPSAS